MQTTGTKGHKIVPLALDKCSILNNNLLSYEINGKNFIFETFKTFCFLYFNI